MNTVIEQLETVKAVMSDLADGSEIPLEIRTKAWCLEITIKEYIRKMKCQHVQSIHSVNRVHDSVLYETDTCCDCGEITQMNRQ